MAKKYANTFQSALIIGAVDERLEKNDKPLSVIPVCP